MSKSLLAPHVKACSIGLISIAGALAAGCAAQVRVAGPPPVYVAPPAVEVAPPPVVAAQIYEAPPPLPVYEQPPCPVSGYLWTPGYWAYAPSGYYWVPGTWVEPPRVGVLWTPGYWGFVGGVYGWHAGYWGPHIGFYGGVNYGYGYVGTGYAGGRWVGNSFAYNQNVTNVNVTVVHNTYNETVVNNVSVTHVSYNGGAGVAATPTAQEKMAAQEPHLAPTPLQQQHVQEAAKNPALFAKANGGHPAIAATTHPATFTGPGVVGAKFAAHPQQGGAKPPVANASAPKPPVANASAPKPPVANASAAKPPVAANTAQPKTPKQQQPKKPPHETKPEGEKT
jgi:hypothetical protein